MIGTAQRRREAEAIWRAGVTAVVPSALLARAVHIECGRLVLAGHAFPLASLHSIAIVGAGKAAAAMAAALETLLLDADAPLPALHGQIHVLNEQAETVHLHSPLRLVPVRPAAQPAPTEAGVQATHALRVFCQRLSPADLAIGLLSGWASAMMPLPPPEIALEEKQAAINALSRAGATIQELNAVRKHLSLVKGGQLAAICSAGAFVTLAISDVIDNPLDVIGSGPTVPDPTTFADAIAILKRYDLMEAVPRSVFRRLYQGLAGRIPETPKRLPASVTAYVIGDCQTALEGAANEARRLGYAVRVWPDPLQGEAREMGRTLIRWAREQRRQGLTPPFCLLAAGETVVSRLRPGGRGGRCQEMILGAFLESEPQPTEGLTLLAAGTDGEDGPTDAAGAFFDEDVVPCARRHGLKAASFLEESRSYDFCQSLGLHFKTGPTSTNVMDLVVLLLT